MKRLLALALCAAVSLAVPPAPAAEPAHLDFVRGLRERGYPDLALEYLQKLSAKPPASLAATLPLEMARCRLEAAKSLADLAQRQQQYTSARAEFQSFLDKNPNSPLAATARADIAQVSVLLGRVQLTRMRQEGGAEAKASLARVARSLLADAATALDTVGKALDTQLAGLEEAKTPEEKAQKKALEDARYQAELELGLVYLDQADTYTDEGNIESEKARGEVVARAAKVFSQLRNKDLKHPACWLARVHLGRCHKENGVPNEARKEWILVGTDTTPASAPARRLAAFYRLELAAPKPEPGENPLKMATDWLKAYPTFRSTPEGAGVRFIYANLKFQQAAAEKAAAVKARLLGDVKTICRELELFENDYRIVAFRLKIKAIAAEGGFARKIADLRSFDDCYIRARYEADLIDDKIREYKGNPEKIPEVRKQQFALIIDALQRALSFAKTTRVPAQDVNEARSMLAFALLTNGDLQGAVKVGEELAYAKPRHNQSVNGAAYALQAYSQMLDAKTGDEKEVKENLRKLAAFMKTTWSEDQTGDMARHRLGAILYKEGQYRAAYDELASIRPSYPEAILSGYLLAMCAKAVYKEQGGADPTWEQKALTALTKLPALPPNPDPVVTQTYVTAKLALGAELFGQKKFAEVEKVATPLRALLRTAPLPADVKEDLTMKAVNQSILARYVQADAEFKAGQYAKANAFLTPVLGELKEGKLPELKKNLELQWGVLGLSLRASVQEGKLDAAQETLQTIQKLSEEGDFAAGGVKTMASIVQLLAEQVGELRRRGEAEKLERTKKALALFLDNLNRGQKEQTPEVALLLTQSYITIDDGKKAAEIAHGWLDKTKEPAPPARNQPTGQDRARWEAMKIFSIRALRTDKQLEAARKEMDATFADVGAEKGWGWRNLEARKENCYLFGAEGKWGPAATGWNQLVNQLQKLKNDARMKDHYFECYFQLVYSLVQAALQPNSTRRDDYLRQAAKLILDLESAAPDLGGKTSKNRFDDLLKNTAELKSVYDQMKRPAGQ